jgi:hypothetical protein
MRIATHLSLFVHPFAVELRNRNPTFHCNDAAHCIAMRAPAVIVDAEAWINQPSATLALADRAASAVRLADGKG